MKKSSHIVAAELGIEAKNQRGVTLALLDHAAQLARECHANAIVVYADAFPSGRWEPAADIAPQVIFVTKTKAAEVFQEELAHRVIRVPHVPLTRIGQIRVAVFRALNRGLLRQGDTIVCLSGVDESGSLDMLMVVEVGHEFEILLTPCAGETIAPNIQPDVLDRVIDIATDLGIEGREGKPVGTLFVIGDSDHVLPLTEQLVLNPFHGYPDVRSILDPRLEETIKEFSGIDGAFIVRSSGMIVTAGAYLKTGGGAIETLPPGLGTRHWAAATITAVTDSVAVAVSQSTGTVTVFQKGCVVLEIERPHEARGGRAERVDTG
jgi:DNA integrity scanning protein DisA with diadenylate cyclase activity